MSYCIDKKSASHTLQGVIAMLEMLGITVCFDKITQPGFEGSKGITKGEIHTCSYSHKCKSEFNITIDKDLPIEDQKLTLSHEIAHIFLGHFTGEAIGEKNYNISIAQREFEAEALGLMLYNFWFGLNGINSEA